MLLGFGVDLAIHQLATLLAQRGHSVTVWAVFTDAKFPSSEPVYSLRNFPVGSTVCLPWYDQTVLRRLRQVPETGSADIYVVTHPMGASLRVLSPTIFMEFGVAPRYGLGLRERINEMYARSLHYAWFVSRAHAILAPSVFLRNSLPRKLLSRTYEFRLGVDHYHHPDIARVSAIRAQLPAGKPITLYVGRLTHERQPYKGVRTLLKMYEGLRNQTHLVLAGVGTEKDRRVAELAGATAILCPPSELMPALYAVCDIYATATRWEGVNLPLLEAMRFGKPVIAFDIPVHKEWVRTGIHGMLAYDEREFVLFWRRLSRESRLRQEMGQRAMESVAGFKWENAAHTVEDLALKLVA